MPAASVLFGVLLANPNAPRTAVALVALAVAGLFLFAPAELFVAGSLLAIGTLTLFSKFAISAGSAIVYGGDAFVFFVLVRALLPKRRVPAHRFATLTRVSVAVFFGLMALGVVRAIVSGNPLDSAVREGIALFYWPALAFSFSRILREEGIDLSRTLRWCVVVLVGLIAYMLLMRVLNRPFESADQVGSLGAVPAASGAVFRRDFGFASAFILYPILALLGMSILTYARDRARLWFAIMAAGIAATGLSLIRAEIYGLMVGAVVVLIMSRSRFSASGILAYANRARVLVSLVISLAIIGGVIFVADPGLAGVLRERAIPDLGAQSSMAQANAEYREEALSAGVRVANHNPLGLGFVGPGSLREAGADPGFLVHSAPGSLLAYLGWPGLLSAIALLGALFVESGHAPSRERWLHPFFVGSFTMMALYGFGAVGLVGQNFVIAAGALVLTARFATAQSGKA